MSRARPAWALRLFGLVVVWAVVGGLLALFATRHQGIDLHIYSSAIRYQESGHDLYGYLEPTWQRGFTYPPFAALVLAPLAAPSFAVAHWLLIGVNLGLVGLILRWVSADVSRSWNLPPWYLPTLLLPLAVALDPIRETIGYGQVNLLLAVLVAVDGVRLARGHTRAVGVGIGLAAAIKLTPAVFILFLFAGRRWRAGLTATGTAVAATLLAAAIDFPLSWRYWTRTLWDTDRVGLPDWTPNQALSGLLARLIDADSPPPTLLWFGLVLALLGIGLTRAVRASRSGDQLGAFTLTGLLSVEVSPIGWTHHLVWVLPAVVVLVLAWIERPSRRRGLAAVATYALFVSSVIRLHWSYVPQHWDQGVRGQLLESAYCLGVLVLICTLPSRPGSDQAAVLTPADDRRRGPAPSAAPGTPG